MSGALEYVMVNFKNRERVYVPAEHIVTLGMSGIKSLETGKGIIQEEQDRADQISFVVSEYQDTESSNKSDMYTETTPYQRLTQDKTVDSITLHYIEGSSEEVFVPYDSENPETLGENTLQQIQSGKIHSWWDNEGKNGIGLAFGEEAYVFDTILE